MSGENTIIRGAKIKIFPTPEQAAQLDLWRRRCISLWNLLLGIEQAAYDGSKFRPKLGWRKIWAAVLIESHANARRSWLEGKTTRVGKNKGKVIPPMTGPEPEPPAPEFLRKVAGGRIGGVAPGVFLWEDELKKVMARLKKVPLTRWIAEMHSHAAQAVCSDIVDAIRAMIRERKKGDAGQRTGFPRFKKQGYAAGSVYFANTQVKFDWAGTVAISNGVGEVRCGPVGNIPEGSKLGECRAWREGDQWWLSAQFRMTAPDPLPATGRECGVKVAAAAIYTVFDGERFFQVRTCRPSARDDALLAAKGRKAARRKKGSKGWREAQAALAKIHARRKNSRSDVIHKGSRAIVNEFDRISIDKMDIKSMTRKNGEKGKKSLRKITASASMYDAAQKVLYKSREAGRVVNQTHALFPSTQICSSCGEIHVDMAKGKRYLICECGARLKRQENASANIAYDGRKTKAAE